MKEIMSSKSSFLLVLFFIIVACGSPSKKNAVVLYQTHCATCHLLPSPEDLPKHIWKQYVLPDMAARMGIIDASNNPLSDLNFDEQSAIIQKGVYPNAPVITLTEWNLLKDYIIAMAPDSLKPNNEANLSKEMPQFKANPIDLDNIKGSFITFLEYNQEDNSIITSDMRGKLSMYDITKGESKTLMRVGGAITDYTKKDSLAYLTKVGFLFPSEIASGMVQIVRTNTIENVPIPLHRPVHTLVTDLDKDGQNELVVSEFGDLTGSLSLLSRNDALEYQKKTLLNLPGAIRVLAKDMNSDGMEDLIAMHSQGNEGITILYQQEGLKFTADPVISFSPVYGTSWFELTDYDGDGDDDIITVNGDNADKSYVQKPYHGMRIFINNGDNQFEEQYFYPLNGATRVLARDFDQDGDIDFGLLAAFPDYTSKSEYAFVYLENEKSEDFKFTPYTFQDSKLGRWFLMDAGDVDNDGDQDIILSSFTYVLTPVPKETATLWEKSNVDLMILENKLIESKKP